MTVPETRLRELALRLIERSDDDVPSDEYDLLTTEAHWQIGLSKELGVPRDRLLSSLSSSEYTAYRAASIVDMAAGKLVQIQAQERVKNGSSGRRFGRRR